jgi:hypothetical protein
MRAEHILIPLAFVNLTLLILDALFHVFAGLLTAG